jgi:hypothetical protein
MFTDGELSYRFHHMPADLRHWRELQGQLRSVVGSFIRERPQVRQVHDSSAHKSAARHGIAQQTPAADAREPSAA